MRILLLTPGTGNFLCGSCMRDNTLARELRALGHDTLIVPLYLPFVLEEQPREPNDGAESAVHMGGINVYLQQKLRLLRFLPRFVHDRLDSPRLLRFAAKRARMTDASGLGPMTLSMVRGEEGRQRDELRRLVEWAVELGPIDVVVLSNVMLAGLARELRAALGCAIVTTLQGEAPFLDGLDSEHSKRCWQVLGERARELDGALAVSHYTAGLMTKRLELDPARVQVVWNGIDPIDFVEQHSEGRAALREPGRPTVGYLARLCHEKGLPTLFEAFVQLKRAIPSVRLVAAGVVLNEDKDLVAALQRRSEELGIADDVELIGPVSREEKVLHLKRCDVFSVPATYGESFGLYLLEAWASGVPCVQPRHGSFPELIEATGAGLLVEPNDPAAIAEGLRQLLEDGPRRASLGARGAATVRDRFSAAQMAQSVADCLRDRVDRYRARAIPTTRSSARTDRC
jgi:glycosyltransferase involved in cell wall biosynthesis